ncbi:alpha/beta-hydrolase [Aureobasidium subglaciale]|uniref:AB hydrolase-1 domain-containing protein n=1 Tax=Aureobasidium subglaciale (strain EXF-2481) TaxID=1043005 RepID=A0A074Y348_AURSE|nr:uncharacterized protein AUEXF2481DRAFT_68995 [Aureobasidium subglaciale EXF-2481]KAI5207266.1 alpha/beta-hydrolase [Aureobasidium subglaciale]KAI5226251.1 alpha/beta-hydrolase [Aureobasidium subglaciale]KAI5229470.1 alpha/beta-hydrolase [Aureobasidium subglaciale]KAI5241779.1 alpha/beta-hydrolase [Aureobasidium subglaciale]KAI5264266.1 alpha/beta-hydrolase [Aureobasidium subglaciale]
MPVEAKPTGFSLSCKEGLCQWWNDVSSAQAEHRLLQLIPSVAPPTASSSSQSTDAPIHRTKNEQISVVDSFGPRNWQTARVPLLGAQMEQFINEFSVEHAEQDTKHNLVMLHGYGAGLGLFYKNFEPFSRSKNWKLYALDLLGMGRSGRPDFDIQARTSNAKVTEVESWFIDALEQWRIQRGIEKMTLLGHSFGAYMAVCYALKYPGHLEKLILASPVGIPEDKYAWSPYTSAPPSTVRNEILQTQHEATGQTESAAPGRPPIRALPRLVASLWAGNFSPFGFVRAAGPFGPSLVSTWTSRRFSALAAIEAKALHDYCYSLFRLRGSGDYALTYILAPGAYARSPLIRRIEGVGRQYLKNDPDVVNSDTISHGSSDKTGRQNPRETGVPVVFMYGDRDWMDKQGGLDSEIKINAAKQKVLKTATEEEKRKENGSAKTFIVPNAGHHLYLDNFEEFNRFVQEEMADVEVRQRQLSEPVT